ncbi:NEL-type E3 ubiquitin ligase domain-containing protein [Pseudomonas sp. 15FMM2]|uniref:NEL-type E3 ubiquitin ligase domain-containing protein n=1 Tax=Pseudomonas imrae TaxID=2992837 RepID=A0ACC7PC50_9PSED
MSDTHAPVAAAEPPAASASLGIHAPFLEKAIPDWLLNASPQRRAELKAAGTLLPDGYLRASPEQRKALQASCVASFTAQIALDKAMAGLQEIDAYARPLLVSALKEHFKLELNVDETYLVLKKPLEVGIFSIEVSSFEVLRLPLLQAALHNFEESECETHAFHASSGFLQKNGATNTFQAITPALTVAQFTRLCRSLDIGAKYQAYLKNYLQPNPVAAEQLRNTVKTAQKAAMRAAAEIALFKHDIEPRDYTLVLSVIDGDSQPWMDGKRVGICDFALMGRQMTGCVMFSIGDLYGRSDERLLYIPNDPEYPLKRYTEAEMTRLFKQRFTTRDAASPSDGSPTAYQQFFSQFVAYADRPYYFSQFTEDAPTATVGQKLAPYAPMANKLFGLAPFGATYQLQDLPFVPPAPLAPNPDPYLAPGAMLRKGPGVWTHDLWDYLSDQHRDKLIADARAHAVPTVDVDARVRSEKLARLLDIGMLVLTGVSMFVPVLGELMTGTMVAQLLTETCEAAHEWSEGDRQAAKAHLIDVAQNLVFMAAMAGGARGLAKLTAVKAEPVIESLEQVTLPNGQTRLWKPDLGGYENTVSLNTSSPNALGQYELDGKTYFRQDGKVYQQIYDESLQCWRIAHPSDTQAYQPILTHNGAGAWRHTLERPLTWERLKLLRRMGHVTEAFTDEELLRIGDISGASDNVLRKMHLDNLPAPAEVTNTLRLFEAEEGVAQVIEQVQEARPLNDRYLYVLPIVTQLPRWPQGLVLEVFEGPELTGPSIRYGSEYQVLPGEVRASIKLSRADVMSGELSTRILQALDEPQITHLLGAEPVQAGTTRAQVLNKQIADFLNTRQSDVFDSLYQGTQPKAWAVMRLQQVTPGLSEAGARAVLAQADSEELERLASRTTRVPLRMLEDARWYARQGRLSNAYAGLYMDNMGSVDSKRLALHALQKMPGWSDNVRLEIRDTSITGLLLDGIGNEAAPVRKYLVKKGPMYQAFDERGDALNGLAKWGDNFFPSLIHALPDEVRRGVGFNHLWQHIELRLAIIEYASGHPDEMALVLEQDTVRKGMNKPPARLRDKRVGYYASGRGAAMDASLVTRVQDVYPGLTDQQASGYLLNQQRAGRTDAQIYGYLQAQLREWQTLESTLDAWVTTHSPTMGELLASMSREDIGLGRWAAAQRIKASWRNAPLADEHPGFRQLAIYASDPLPALTASFPHVRELTLSVPDHDGSFLALCPSLEALDVTMPQSDTERVFEALRSLRHLTRLTLRTQAPLQVIPSLTTLSGLEDLSLHCTGAAADSPALDVHGFTRLRKLKVTNLQMKQWPIGVLELPLLERLDLRETGIDTLASNLYPGHDQLLRGLSLDWSKITRESFKPIYDYVRSQPSHLIDSDEMVRDYTQGELFRLAAVNIDSPTLRSNLAMLWPEPQARLDAIEALSVQGGELDRQLQLWLDSTTQQTADREAMNSVVSTLKLNWRSNLARQHIFSGDLITPPQPAPGFPAYIPQPSAFDLSGLQLSSLPEVPAGAFNHVRTLKLTDMRMLDLHLQRFALGFHGTQTLIINNTGLTAMSFNLSYLPELEHLNLSNNPLNTLNVGALSRLHSLSVRGTQLQALPFGVEYLQSLAWLDMRETPVASLALSSAHEQLLINTYLSDARLSEQAKASLVEFRQQFEQAWGLPAGSLTRLALEAQADTFVPTAGDALNVHRLLPLPPAEPAQGLLSLQSRVRRLFPALNEPQALQWVDKMHEEGFTDLQLHERINGWTQTLDALTRRLNGWLFIRETTGGGGLISSRSRQTAAQAIIECWRGGVLKSGSEASAELDLGGSRLGDLPELPVSLAHVGTLQLRGVRLSEQGSNAFLRAFPNVHTLDLSGNPLFQALPEAIADMAHLRRLDLSYTGLIDAEALHGALSGLEHLQELNLASNNLERLRLDGFRSLQALDLRNNRLTQWPEGIWQAESVTRLNLANNDISSIPSQALDGTHDQLLMNTDLSDNGEMLLGDLERLRDYANQRHLEPVAGYTHAELDNLIDGVSSHGDSEESESGGESEQFDEEIPDEPVGDEQLVAWLATLDPEVQSGNRALWEGLQDEPGHEAFFHLLLRLQDTAEFRVSRSDLTRRVWEVVNAAGSDSELRQVLFRMSDTHGTCVDGRILTFSGLEVKVFEYNTLRTIDPVRLDLKGSALLKLSRQLFRLGEAEKLADQSISIHGHQADPAEVRLQYRVSLREPLDLPGQPGAMSFARPLIGEPLARAIQAVNDAEASDAFYEDLITRDYWVDYLKQKSPERFTALEQDQLQQQEQLEDAYPDFDQAYTQAQQALGIELEIARNRKLLEWSRQEVAQLSTAVRDPAQPGSSRDLT